VATVGMTEEENNLSLDRKAELGSVMIQEWSVVSAVEVMLVGDRRCEGSLFQS
jgi:hypothetical protein